MASSLKEYLRRYTTDAQDKSQKKKKKKHKPNIVGAVTIVDDDPLWQREIREESPADNEEEDAPLVIKDVEVKRMQKMEALKMYRPYLSIGDDGSGWVTVQETAKQRSVSPVRDVGSTYSSLKESPSRDSLRGTIESPARKMQHDSPDLSPPRKSHHVASDLRKGKKLHDTPNLSNARCDSADLSPPRKMRDDGPDLSPPRKTRHDSPDLPPPRKWKLESPDLSPPRKRRHDSPSKKMRLQRGELQLQATSQHSRSQHGSLDLSPPRKNRQEITHHSPPRQKRQHAVSDLSPPRSSAGKREKMGDGTAAGLQSGRQLAEEIERKNREASKRFLEMDVSISGRGANTIYRDKHGKRLESMDELLKLQQAEKPPKEKPLEWGKGLAQKREAEARQAEIEEEKSKPFTRTRDDPDLDKYLKERVRWGDPMAHLVKNKNNVPVLEDLGERQEMRDSGFIIPQDVPLHSWLKRGIHPPPNRYGIKPGRHWDGVDRSTGFEKDSFKNKNEKKANELEAYLWSVSEM